MWGEKADGTVIVPHTCLNRSSHKTNALSSIRVSLIPVSCVDHESSPAMYSDDRHAGRQTPLVYFHSKTGMNKAHHSCNIVN